METVVARFHHPGRDLAELETLLAEAGATDPRIIGYTVVLTFDSDSPEHAMQAARKALEEVGATRVEVASAASGDEPRSARRSPPDAGTEAEANLMARIEMNVFGHP